MKYQVMNIVRGLGLLPLADRARFQHRRIQSWQRNRRFVRLHPDYSLPPAHLAFDAYNNVDWETYDRAGKLHAQVFADAILAHAAPGPIAVMEWGCGPGRLIRHLPELLASRDVALTGTDYNHETIAWCRANLPGIAFAENGLMPPLPFPDESFDVVYNFSVFTHLSAEAHIAWAAELRRVLRPGGLLLSTTHGDEYLYLLAAADERRRYASGEIVTQAGYEEGKKFYFALHPPTYVRDTLFSDYVDVVPLAVPASAGMLQTLWRAAKPASGTAS